MCCTEETPIIIIIDYNDNKKGDANGEDLHNN